MMTVMDSGDKDAVAQSVFPGELVDGTVLDPLMPFIESLVASSDEAPRRVAISTDAHGDRKAESFKLSNLRLRLREAVLTSVPAGGILVAQGLKMWQSDERFFVPFICLKLIAIAKDLLTIDINPDDAQVLYEACRFRREERFVSFDSFLAYMADRPRKERLSREQIDECFDHLEHLGCLRRLDTSTGTEFVVTETVVIR